MNQLLQFKIPSSHTVTYLCQYVGGSISAVLKVGDRPSPSLGRHCQDPRNDKGRSVTLTREWAFEAYAQRLSSQGQDSCYPKM